jgi:hypothetical protein
MGMIGIAKRVAAKDVAAAAKSPARFLEPGTGELSLEKMWHAIHWLLTGAPIGGPEPLSLAILGGQPAGADLGFGPARLLAPEQVRAVAAALKGIDFDALWSRFDAARMDQDEIYPQVWDEPEDELREEIAGYYQELALLYESAAQAGDGMLLAIM